LGIDSRPYARIRDGYIALKERAQPFSKILLIFAYALQDAKEATGELPQARQMSEDTTLPIRAAPGRCPKIQQKCSALCRNGHLDKWTCPEMGYG